MVEDKPGKVDTINDYDKLAYDRLTLFRLVYDIKDKDKEYYWRLPPFVSGLEHDASSIKRICYKEGRFVDEDKYEPPLYQWKVLLPQETRIVHESKLYWNLYIPPF
jgi:hypothetical protein